MSDINVPNETHRVKMQALEAMLSHSANCNGNTILGKILPR